MIALLILLPLFSLPAHSKKASQYETSKNQMQISAGFKEAGLESPIESMKSISKELVMITFKNGQVAAMSKAELQNRVQSFSEAAKKATAAAVAVPVSSTPAIPTSARYNQIATQIPDQIKDPPAIENAAAANAPAAKIVAAKYDKKIYGDPSARNCSRIDDEDRTQLSEKYSHDVVGFVEKNIQLLHQTSTNEAVIDVIQNAFAYQDWTRAIGNTQTAIREQKLTKTEKQQFDFLVPNSILHKYMDQVKTSRAEEAKVIEHAKRFNLPEQVTSQIADQPLRPMVKSVVETSCNYNYQKELYGCQHGQSLLLVTAQIQPSLSCHPALEDRYRGLRQKAQVTYVVKVDSASGPVIVDFVKDGISWVKVQRDQLASANLNVTGKMGGPREFSIAKMKSKIYEGPADSAQNRFQADLNHWNVNLKPSHSFQAQQYTLQNAHDK